ncbi:MAG TPA: hypothetical protein VEA69_01265 [Tepidisphaeraceae bacterium]|nr:hypothetical protein [Tepidisphaeraceae bacterium]
MRLILASAMWCAFGLSLFLWANSHRLTSLGIEFERRHGDQLENRWYGVVYPGTGGVIAGGEVSYEPYHGQPYDAFDVGGAWLRPPYEDRATTWWERRGFVWVWASGRCWVGIPAWLAVVLCGLPLLWGWRRRRRKTSDASAERGAE